MFRVLFFVTLFSFKMLHSAITVDDRSGMNSTTIQGIITLKHDQDLHALKEIIRNIQPGVQIMTRGAQHSQGGHSIAQDGLIVDLSQWKNIEFIKENVIRVQAGATWKDVLEVVNTRRKSVSIMQSDYDFSIGGSISTNVHGCQVNKPPFVDSVEGFHIITAKGKLHYCSRLINRELFQAAIGGYGLLGIITSVDLKLRPNNVYNLDTQIISSKNFLDYFNKEVKNNPKVEMFFARPRLSDNNYMEDLVVWTYHKASEEPVSGKLVARPLFSKMTRFIFERTQANDFFRQLRWKLESGSLTKTLFGQLDRNAILYTSSVFYTNENKLHNDLLQEYFIPERHFEEFYNFLLDQKEDFQGSLMNLTIRHVSEEKLTILNYAREPMLCFIMLFRGPKGKEFDAKVGGLARKLIDKAQSLGGTYYLPYRPYATKDQFRKAYPEYKKFKEIKLKYDPKERFSNQFYQEYLN